MNIRRVAFDHPDAVKLNDQVQAEYAVRYGDEGDVTPLDPSMFEPPTGLYLIAYDAQGRPVATGGWRTQDENDEGYSDGDAELKRMYVIEEARGPASPAASWPPWRRTPARPAVPAWFWRPARSSPRPSPCTSPAATSRAAKFGHYRFHEDEPLLREASVRTSGRCRRDHQPVVSLS